MQRAGKRIHGVGIDVHGLIELARGAATPHERALVRRVLAARLPAHPPPPGIVRRRFPRTWAVAAGLLLVAAGALFFARRAEHPESGLLDHSPPLVALPLETGVRVQLGAAPRGGEYLVAVFAAGAPEGEALLRTRTREETWNLPADLADAWRL